MSQQNQTQSEGVYTSIDLNTTGTTPIFNPDEDGEITGVYLDNGGTSAEVNLEVTDGTSTGILATSGAGGSIEFGETFRIGKDDSVQLTVTTVEGAALTETAVLFKTQ